MRRHCGGIVSVKKILNVECGFASSDKKFKRLLDGELSGPLRINIRQVIVFDA